MKRFCLAIFCIAVGDRSSLWSTLLMSCACLVGHLSLSKTRSAPARSSSPPLPPGEAAFALEPGVASALPGAGLAASVATLICISFGKSQRGGGEVKKATPKWRSSIPGFRCLKGVGAQCTTRETQPGPLQGTSQPFRSLANTRSKDPGLTPTRQTAHLFPFRTPLDTCLSPGGSGSAKTPRLDPAASGAAFSTASPGLRPSARRRTGTAPGLG